MRVMAQTPLTVITGLDPVIQGGMLRSLPLWNAGSSPAMTMKGGT